MRRASWKVGGFAIRPAGPEDRCFYCGVQVGDEHNDGCVIRRRTVVVRAIVEHVVVVPEDWDQYQVEFHRNEGSWCADNLVADLEKVISDDGCLCDRARFEYVREATKKDEADNNLFVKNLEC